MCHWRPRRQICCMYCWYRWKFASDVVETSGTGDKILVDTRGKCATSVIGTSGAPWLANISANFWKIQNDPNIIFRGLVEADSWKKTWSKKSRGTAPLNEIYILHCMMHLSLLSESLASTYTRHFYSASSPGPIIY